MVCGILLVFVPSYVWIVIFRFLQGLVSKGCWTAGYILGEFKPSWRSKMGCKRDEGGGNPQNKRYELKTSLKKKKSLLKFFWNHTKSIKSFSPSDYLGFFSSKWQWPSKIKGWRRNSVTSRQAFCCGSAPCCRLCSLLAGERQWPQVQQQLPCCSPVADRVMTGYERSRQRVGKTVSVVIQRVLKGKQRLCSLKITEEQHVLAEEKTSCLGVCALAWVKASHGTLK